MQQRRLNPRHHVRKIMALSEIYGVGKVARAMEDAFTFQAFSCEYLANLLETRARPLPEPSALHLTRRQDLLEIEVPEPTLPLRKGLTMTASPAMQANTSPGTDPLNAYLAYLKLPYLRAHYEALAKEAAQHGRSHLEYLAKLIEGEAHLREDHRIQRRIRLARFPVLKTLEQFHWSWPKKINRLQVQDLFRLKFIDGQANVIFLGGVGLGKSHLSIALGHTACLAGYSVPFTTAIDVINTLPRLNPPGDSRR